MIQIVTKTRIHGVEAFKGSQRRTSAAGLIAAVKDLAEIRRLVRSHTDSDARAWVEVDGERVDVEGVEMAASDAEARSAAKAILTRIAA